MLISISQQTSILRERQILQAAQKTNIPFIPSLIAATQDDTHLHILLEYLPACDLELLLQEHNTFTEHAAKVWIAQTVVALDWLHDLGFVHRY